jgi:hypothetical protein
MMPKSIKKLKSGQGKSHCREKFLLMMQATTNPKKKSISKPVEI